MRLILIFVLTGIICTTNAQQSFERKGFIFGTAVGISSIRLSTTSLPTETQGSLSFPNFKIGKMISKRAALVLYLPGSIYSFKGTGRQRDRGFEGIIPSAQCWIKERWWILGGAGLTLDAPAFYDIETEDERKFYFGPSLIVGTGYEIWRQGKFALDIQSRIHYGQATVPEGIRKGLAFNFMIGFNWY